MKILKMIIFAIFVFSIISCSDQSLTEKEGEHNLPSISERVEAYAPVEIKADLNHLTERQVELIKRLVKAGKFADLIFWNMASHDALASWQMIKNDPNADHSIMDYILINYGPYDRIYEQRRFFGDGPAEKPDGAGFYPEDITRKVFDQYVQEHPKQAEALKNQYSVIVHDNGGLKAIPYHQFYADEVQQLAIALREAAEYADNASLKDYLLARAHAVENDDYYESDVKWMQLKDNDIDVVIGPIENYEDALFNYKTAYEVAVMVKDPVGTEKLQRYIAHLDNLEKQLPEKEEYIRESAGKGNVLEVVNIVYFGGDFQAGIKTIAASLPNDPRIHEQYGGKKQMYKNLIEAKYDKILIPISKIMIAEKDTEFIDREAFTDFITLHEVSHTLGRSWVYGKEKVKVRTALKELYSGIEEAKADILAMYAVPYLIQSGIYSEASAKERMITYLAGIFRSIRFGIGEAHGSANMMQFNFLVEKGAFYKEKGKWRVNFNQFHQTVTEFSAAILNIEAEGDYEGAKQFVEKYGEMPDDLADDLKNLSSVPRDLNTSYAIMNEMQLP